MLVSILEAAPVQLANYSLNKVRDPEKREEIKSKLIPNLSLMSFNERACLLYSEILLSLTALFINSSVVYIDRNGNIVVG